MKKSELRKIIRESIKELKDEENKASQMRAAEKEEAEEGSYNVTNTKTGQTISVDRNHDMYSKVKNAISKGSIKRTKLKESSKLNEGIFCCWFKGGCCGFSTSWEDPVDDMVEHVITWTGCCGHGGAITQACCGSHPADNNQIKPVDPSNIYTPK